jgi:hypothetical protein
MPSTTVHIPDNLLRRIDRLAESRGISRNRLVIEALADELSRDAGEWPEGFFEYPHERDALEVLREATLELEASVQHARRNRGAPLL